MKKYYITLVCLALAIFLAAWHLRKTLTMKEEARKPILSIKADNKSMPIGGNIHVLEKDDSNIEKTNPILIDDRSIIDKEISVQTNDARVADVLEQLMRRREYEENERKLIEEGYSIHYGMDVEGAQIGAGQELLMRRREERFEQAGAALPEEYALYLLDKYDGWTAEEVFWVYYKLEWAKGDDKEPFQEQYELEALSLVRERK